MNNYLINASTCVFVVTGWTCGFMLALMDERARASSLPGKFRKTGSWNGFSGVAVATRKDWPPLRGGHWRKQRAALVLALENNGAGPTVASTMITRQRTE